VEKFIPDPFSSDRRARLYRTGDRARWLPDGTIEFLGRLDEQVKLRGFRIEPGEVEAALKTHERVHCKSSRQKELSMFNSQCLNKIFESQVNSTPDAVAVVCGPEQYTYAQLNARANRIANYLRTLGAGRDVLVGLYIERSTDMVAAILGIAKAGAAYVPLDASYPRVRLSLLLEDSRVPLVLTQRALLADLPYTDTARIVCIDNDVPVKGDASNPPDNTAPDNAAYVIYTSGSTGVPKGVVVEHRQLVRLFNATHSWFAFGNDDVWTMFHSFGFDFSVWEMWGALLYGGKLVVVPSGVTRAPDAFYALLARERVTVLNQTPSAFHGLARVEETRSNREPLALRLIIFGGETLDPRMLRGWIGHHGDDLPRLINMYGITETTVHVTYRPITRADIERNGGSPIGVPIPDLFVYLLDEHGERVPRGTVGEICVGGEGVARGYLNRPELNEQRFLPDPFRREAGTRMYRSGDLAIEREDGDLWYVGRADTQIKIRGFRIEPGEVESVLRRSARVSDVVVVGRDYGQGDHRIVAYVVPAPKPRGDESVLLDRLRALVTENLPEHMRPSAYVVLDSLPLDANGKVDRKALPHAETVTPVEANGLDVRLLLTPIERTVADLWKELVGVQAVRAEDDFFDMGGTSLGAIKLLLLIQERLGFTLEMSVWARCSTLGKFAELLSKEVPDVVRLAAEEPRAAGSIMTLKN
jgi:amino acid adenylation domain-containing protein